MQHGGSAGIKIRMSKRNVVKQLS